MQDEKPRYIFGDIAKYKYITNLLYMIVREYFLNFYLTPTSIILQKGHFLTILFHINFPRVIMTTIV